MTTTPASCTQNVGVESQLLDDILLSNTNWEELGGLRRQVKEAENQLKLQEKENRELIERLGNIERTKERLLLRLSEALVLVRHERMKTAEATERANARLSLPIKRECPKCRSLVSMNEGVAGNLPRPHYVRVLHAANTVEVQFTSRDYDKMKRWLQVTGLDVNSDGLPTLPRELERQQKFAKIHQSVCSFDRADFPLPRPTSSCSDRPEALTSPRITRVDFDKAATTINKTDISNKSAKISMEKEAAPFICSLPASSKSVTEPRSPCTLNSNSHASVHTADIAQSPVFQYESNSNKRSPTESNSSKKSQNESNSNNKAQNESNSNKRSQNESNSNNKSQNDFNSNSKSTSIPPVVSTQLSANEQVTEEAVVHDQSPTRAPVNQQHEVDDAGQVETETEPCHARTPENDSLEHHSATDTSMTVTPQPVKSDLPPHRLLPAYRIPKKAKPPSLCNSVKNTRRNLESDQVQKQSHSFGKADTPTTTSSSSPTPPLRDMDASYRNRSAKKQSADLISNRSSRAVRKPSPVKKVDDRQRSRNREPIKSRSRSRPDEQTASSSRERRCSIRQSALINNKRLKTRSPSTNSRDRKRRRSPLPAQEFTYKAHLRSGDASKSTRQSRENISPLKKRPPRSSAEGVSSRDRRVSRQPDRRERCPVDDVVVSPLRQSNPFSSSGKRCRSPRRSRSRHDHLLRDREESKSDGAETPKRHVSKQAIQPATSTPRCSTQRSQSNTNNVKLRTPPNNQVLSSEKAQDEGNRSIILKKSNKSNMCVDEATVEDGEINSDTSMAVLELEQQIVEAADEYLQDAFDCSTASLPATPVAPVETPTTSPTKQQQQHVVRLNFDEATQSVDGGNKRTSLKAAAADRDEVQAVSVQPNVDCDIQPAATELPSTSESTQCHEEPPIKLFANNKNLESFTLEKTAPLHTPCKEQSGSSASNRSQSRSTTSRQSQSSSNKFSPRTVVSTMVGFSLAHFQTSLPRNHPLLSPMMSESRTSTPPVTPDASCSRQSVFQDSVHHHKDIHQLNLELRYATTDFSSLADLHSAATNGERRYEQEPEPIASSATTSEEVMHEEERCISRENSRSEIDRRSVWVLSLLQTGLLRHSSDD